MRVFQQNLFSLSRSNHRLIFSKQSIIFFVGGLLLLSSCNNSNPSTIMVTEVVVVEGVEEVVTRLVRQTVAVTVTPNSVTPTDQIQPTILDLSITGEFPDIDPQKTDALNGIDFIENLFVGLTNFNHESNSIEPELALNWDVSPDGHTWTFHLRNDIFWVRPQNSQTNEDGLRSVEPVRQVVAEDAVFAVQRGCNRETRTPDAFILHIIQGCKQIYEMEEVLPADLEDIGVEAVDDFTLRFSLTKPSAHFLTLTSMWLFHPIPKELVEEFEDEWQMVENLTTSGPYFVAQDSNPETRLILQRNPLWPITKRGNVDIINIVLLNDVTQSFQLWRAKRLDVALLPAVERDTFLINSPQKAKLVPNQTVFYLGFNFNSGVFREPEVRRAFNAAIDRDQLVEDVYGGRAFAMKHIIPPGIVAAQPIEEVGKGYDPDYSRQQMAESGFRNCRLLPPITYLVSSSDLSLRQAELIRDMWVEELGCSEEQIIIEQVQFGTLLADTRQDALGTRPDLWELGWATSYPDAQNWVGDLLHCTDSENRQNRPCSEADELIDQAANEINPEQRYSLYREIENLFFGDNGLQPLAPLYVTGDYILVQTWLDFTPSIFGGEQYDTYIIEANLKRLEQSR